LSSSGSEPIEPLLTFAVGVHQSLAVHGAVVFHLQRSARRGRARAASASASAVAVAVVVVIAMVVVVIVIVAVVVMVTVVVVGTCGRWRFGCGRRRSGDGRFGHRGRGTVAIAGRHRGGHFGGTVVVGSGEGRRLGTTITSSMYWYSVT
jgi:uncharacterized membrane protein YgcG